jgi:cation:H+ antiporter
LTLLGALLFVAGMALILWGADRFTDGAMASAARLAISPFLVGTVLSGLEPENLATGVGAALGGLDQVALGTVVGAGIFMLTAGLGLALLLVPMPLAVPPAGPLAMLLSLVPFGLVLADGEVSRAEGAALVAAAVGLLAWLFRRSRAFRRAAAGDGDDDRPRSTAAAVAWLGGSVVAMVLGADLVVEGARRLIATLAIPETVFGMTVVGLGESLEETARMAGPARRGHPELAWGNVVGTIVILVTLNLGLIALVRPLTVDPLVLRFHAPYLVGCTVLVAAAMLVARALGRTMGALLVALYVAYLAFNARSWLGP